MSLPDNLDRSRMADVADTADGMERATLSRSASIGHFPPRTQSALYEIESVNRAHVVESGRSTEYSRADSNVTAWCRDDIRASPLQFYQIKPQARCMSCGSTVCKIFAVVLGLIYLKLQCWPDNNVQNSWLTDPKTLE